MAYIVGIAGRAGVGKDTLADHLVEKHGFFRYRLAHPLKAALCTMFEWNPALLDDREWKEAPQERLCGKSPRELMQTLGTDWGRELVGEHIWLVLATEFEKRLPPEARIVVPDIRFENEAKWVRQYGMMIHVHRDVPGVAPHDSESGIEGAPADLFLTNVEGRPEEMLSAVDGISGP